MSTETESMFIAQGLRLAIDEEMKRDKSVFILGEDVGLFGGSFGVTRGLYEKYGENRVRDTPISENAIHHFLFILKCFFLVIGFVV